MINHKPSLLLLAALVSFPQLSETIYTPCLPELTKYFLTTANMMQNSLSIYFIGFAFGVFLFGILCDIIGRRNTMIAGICVYIIASFLCAISRDITFLLAARFLQAFGASVGSVVTQTMLRDLYTGEARARVFSQLTGVIAFAPAIGPLIGSQLSYAFSPMMNFWFLCVLGLTLLWATLLKLKETLIEPAVAKTNMLTLAKRMVRDKHIWTCAVFIAAHNGILFSFHAEAPFVLIDMLEMNPNHYGIMGLVIGSSVFIGSMINSRLLEKLGSYQLNVLGCFIMTIATAVLVLAISEVSLLSLTLMRTIFLCTIAIMIIGLGISLPNCLSMALKDYRDAIGSAGAILGLMYYIMISAFLAVMSYIHNGTLRPMPVYFFALSALLLIGSLSMKRKALLAQA